MASSPPVIEQTFDVDKLSYEIFSILESKFLFGYDDPKLFLNGSVPATPLRSATHSPCQRVRILSIDGFGSSDAIHAAGALVRLETTIREISGDPTARIADYFDCAAGSGAGGVLASMLFTRGARGKPPMSAGEAFRILSKNSQHRKKSFHGIFHWSGKSKSRRFKKMFGESTLKEAIKPLLVPCYDMATNAAFLFSRADALERSSLDFRIIDVCEATCRKRLMVRSLDGCRRILAVGGGVVMANPTAAAITHVLNNKKEFPYVGCVDDLLVVSLGCGEMEHDKEILGIAAEGVSDTVDQAVALAFGHSRRTNYIRIQGSGCGSDKMLSERNVESVLFRGKKVSDKTNVEKLDYFAHELMEEHDRRRTNNTTNVPIMKEEKVVVSTLPREIQSANPEIVSRVNKESVVNTSTKKLAPFVPPKSHSALVGWVMASIL